MNRQGARGAAAEVSAAYHGPEALALANWRRRISELYAEVRATRDPAAAWRHWLATRSALFRAHPASPLPAGRRRRFGRIAAFDYDPRLRFEVEAVPAGGETESVLLDGDGELRRSPVARTAGLAPALGAELTLWWIEGYGGGLFLPFRDATSGAETYGGGRYLIDAIKGADLGLSPAGRLVLDFNFAYNPSCALDDRWMCPLAPPENTLTAPVRGGELAARPG